LKELSLPFPNVEFQAGLAEIASLKPEAVYSFYAGGGALKYMQDFAAAGLKNSIQLWSPGFLTDGVEKAAGAAGEGVKTALHYVESLDNAENKKFRADYNASFQRFPDVYAVQGWDTTQLLDIGLKAVGGDVSKQDDLFKAMRGAKFNSPRGPFRLSAAQNPIHNFYLRELKGGENVYLGIAATDVSDPTTGCSLA
jgi:branched-chain amino acid transport system substrate-binding protein